MASTTIKITASMMSGEAPAFIPRPRARLQVDFRLSSFPNGRAGIGKTRYPISMLYDTRNIPAPFKIEDFEEPEDFEDELDYFLETVFPPPPSIPAYLRPNSDEHHQIMSQQQSQKASQPGRGGGGGGGPRGGSGNRSKGGSGGGGGGSRKGDEYSSLSADELARKRRERTAALRKAAGLDPLPTTSSSSRHRGKGAQDQGIDVNKLKTVDVQQGLKANQALHGLLKKEEERGSKFKSANIVQNENITKVLTAESRGGHAAMTFDSGFFERTIKPKELDHTTGRLQEVKRMSDPEFLPGLKKLLNKITTQNYTSLTRQIRVEICRLGPSDFDIFEALCKQMFDIATFNQTQITLYARLLHYLIAPSKDIITFREMWFEQNKNKFNKEQLAKQQESLKLVKDLKDLPVYYNMNDANPQDDGAKVNLITIIVKFAYQQLANELDDNVYLKKLTNILSRLSKLYLEREERNASKNAQNTAQLHDELEELDFDIEELEEDFLDQYNRYKTKQYNTILFLGELYTYGLVQPDTILFCLHSLLSTASPTAQPTETDVDMACLLLNKVGKTLDHFLTTSQQQQLLQQKTHANYHLTKPTSSAQPANPANQAKAPQTNSGCPPIPFQPVNLSCSPVFQPQPAINQDTNVHFKLEYALPSFSPLLRAYTTTNSAGQQVNSTLDAAHFQPLEDLPMLDAAAFHASTNTYTPTALPNINNNLLTAQKEQQQEQNPEQQHNEDDEDDENDDNNNNIITPEHLMTPPSAPQNAAAAAATTTTPATITPTSGANMHSAVNVTSPQSIALQSTALSRLTSLTANKETGLFLLTPSINLQPSATPNGGIINTTTTPTTSLTTVSPSIHQPRLTLSTSQYQSAATLAGTSFGLLPPSLTQQNTNSQMHDAQYKSQNTPNTSANNMPHHLDAAHTVDTVPLDLLDNIIAHSTPVKQQQQSQQGAVATIPLNFTPLEPIASGHDYENTDSGSDGDDDDILMGGNHDEEENVAKKSNNKAIANNTNIINAILNDISPQTPSHLASSLDGVYDKLKFLLEVNTNPNVGNDMGCQQLAQSFKITKRLQFKIADLLALRRENWGQPVPQQQAQQQGKKEILKNENNNNNNNKVVAPKILVKEPTTATATVAAATPIVVIKPTAPQQQEPQQQKGRGGKQQEKQQEKQPQQPKEKQQQQQQQQPKAEKADNSSRFGGDKRGRGGKGDKQGAEKQQQNDHKPQPQQQQQPKQQERDFGRRNGKPQKDAPKDKDDGFSRENFGGAKDTSNKNNNKDNNKNNNNSGKEKNKNNNKEQNQKKDNAPNNANNNNNNANAKNAAAQPTFKITITPKPE